MARQLDEREITELDLQDYISTADDFRLEMDVFRMCQNAGCNVLHGGTYRDRVTGLDRQFDLRAHLSRSYLNAKFAIECKSLRKNYPLLVSRVPRMPRESYHDIVVSRPVTGGYQYNSGVAKTKFGSSPFRSQEPVGKATTQVGRSSQGGLLTEDSEVWKKWSQAVASAHDLVDEAHCDHREQNRLAFSVIFAVLVISDGTLWTVDYDNNGNQSAPPTQRDNCAVYLGKRIPPSPFNPSYEYTLSHLLIFTRAGVANFLEQLCQSDFWENYFWNSEEFAEQIFGRQAVN